MCGQDSLSLIISGLVKFPSLSFIYTPVWEAKRPQTLLWGRVEWFSWQRCFFIAIHGKSRRNKWFWRFSMLLVSTVHRVVTLGGGCCEPAMFLSARSPSHPYSGGAGATHGPLHCVCSAWESSSHPSLAAQWPGPPGDWDHPHGVLPTRGSVWGLPALQQTHSLQQWQLHDCGHQPAGLSQPNYQRTLPWKAFSR